jgi:ribonuclease-3
MPQGPEAAAGRLPSSIFGHTFKDLTLLKAALTHPSSADNSLVHLPFRYQQLEFLGDAVWNLFVADALVSLLPGAAEGELSLWRARLVSAGALARLANSLALPPLLLLGKGEESSGGRERASTLSSGFEAVIGAIYLDGGIDCIRRLARSACDEQLSDQQLGPDPKSALQQLAQSRLRVTPRYHLVSRSGSAHTPTFEVEVRLGQSPLGRGSGRSRRDAEREAARQALANLDTGIATISGSETS